MISRKLLHRLASTTLLCCASMALQAQTVYRIVGPDGKVTFSDKPPVTVAQGKVVATGTGASGAASVGSLPFELRQVATKFPVTLYTSTQCSPCDAGRALLNSRGIPFTERTVSTNEDTESLQRISGDSSLPFMTIGGQRLKGFSDAEWVQYLDAAGYPKVSSLPSGYKNASATPLVVAQKPAAPVPKIDEKIAPPPPPPLPDKTPDNPAGIKF